MSAQSLRISRLRYSEGSHILSQLYPTLINKQSNNGGLIHFCSSLYHEIVHSRDE